MPRFLRRSARLAVCALVPLIALGGCSSDARLDEVRKSVIVDAEGSQLTGAMLEQYLLRVPEDVTPVAADLLISTWIDVALLQHARANGIDLLDSATATRALRPDAVRGVLDGFARERLAARAEPTDAEADSIYRMGYVRVYQQLLVPMDVRDTSLRTREKRLLLEQLIARIQAGESFDSLVARFSVDSVFGPNGGFLPAGEYEDIQARPVANQIWPLAPGEVTARPVPSPYGAHIFRRATMEQSRPGLKAWLKPRLSARESGAFGDSVVQANQVWVAADAVERLRRLAPDPMKADVGEAEFASWLVGGERTGKLTPELARIWLAVMPPRQRVQFPGAADTTIGNWALQVAKFEVIARAIAGADLPTPEMRQAMMPEYEDLLRRVGGAWELLGRGRPRTLATAAVLDTLVTGKIRYRPPPGALLALLRQRFNVKVNHDDVHLLVEAAALERARREAADTTLRRTPPDSAPADSAVPAESVGG